MGAWRWVLVVCIVGGLVCKVGVMSICGVSVVNLRGFLRDVDVVTSRSIIPSCSVSLSLTT